jgi:curved DNA-binding protein CbpA
MSVAVKEMGSLADRSAFDLLQTLCNPERQGVVVFASSKEKISIIVQNAQILVPQTLLPPDQILQALFQKGTVNNEDFVQIQQLMNEKNWTMAQTLAHLEIVSDDAYEAMLEKKLNESLKKVLSWTQGKYAWVAEVPGDTVAVSFLTHLPTLLFKNRIQHHLDKKSGLPQQKMVPKQPLYTEQSEQCDLGPDVFQVLKKWQEVTYAQSLPKLLPDADPNWLAAVVQAALDFQWFEIAEEKSEASTFDMQKVFEGHASMNFYELMGLPTSASASQAQKQYLLLAKKYHPDRIKKESGIDRSAWEKVFGKITEAYQTLSKSDKKKEYDAKLASNGQDVDNLDVKKVLTSEEKFFDGMDLLRRGQFEQAEAKFHEAIELYDQEYEYYVRLGWAMYRSGIKSKNMAKVNHAKKYLKRGLEKGRAMDDVYYYHGMICKMEKDYNKALAFFNKALEENQYHQQALQEKNATARLV